MHLKLCINKEKRWETTLEKILNSNNNALISTILLYGSEIWGIDCNGKIEKGSGRISAEKILKMATRYK